MWNQPPNRTSLGSNLPGRTWTRPLVALLGLVSALVATACATTNEVEATSIRIVLRQFASGYDGTYELRSETHTSRVDFYSNPRDEASVKILRDDLARALVRDFDRAGFLDSATPGPGPDSAAGGVKKVIEIERDGVVSHIASAPGAPVDQAVLITRLTAGFFDAFNSVQSYQTIESEDERTIFVGPAN